MTLSDVVQLRHLTDEQNEQTYGNQFLEDLIISSGSIRAAAAALWEMKAARYAALVDTSEAGASRKMSQMASQATAMAKQFGGDGGAGTGSSSRFAVTRPIERA